MYGGGVLMILATPLALGSLWALGCAVLLGIIAARLSTKPDCRIREADPLDELGVHAQNFPQTSPCRT
jgi:protein-S-isoprenylcysteine O-methyltransferase Ste14